MEHDRAEIMKPIVHDGTFTVLLPLFFFSGMPERVLGDLCCLMSVGQYPGLYSDSDMQAMATAMTPGQVQTKRIDKIELAFERYLRKVRQNMHVILSLDYSGELQLAV